MRYLAVAILTLLSGCGGSEKILVNVYAPPVESKKVTKMIDASEQKGGKYLSMAINPDVENSKTETLSSLLIDSVKEKLTETNFIYIHPIYDDSKVTLNMKVVDYKFEKTGNEIRANLQVSFNILRGTSELYTKIYKDSDSRFSKSGQGLPSEGEILIKLTENLAKKFVKDISPLKTKNLRELMELPDGLQHVNKYAVARNYRGAIEAMKNFNGERDVEYYYNLAVFYEALAGEEENFKFLKEASENYNQAMVLSEGDDELVVKTKAQFDNFYRLFEQIDKQSRANQKVADEVEDEFGL
jgi:hypothetical protein